jgi:SPP1 family phage portal protein
VQVFLEAIKKNDISVELINQMIEAHRQDHDRMIRLYTRYKAEEGGVPILSRKPIEYEDFETGTIIRIDNKVNNRLNNAFDADIVDTKIGYFLGHPISYNVDDNAVLQQETVDEFNLRNNVEDADAEWGKMAAICGYGARLAYIDLEGKERIVNLPPWECIILSDRNITEPVYALRYYTIENPITKTQTLKVEFYDNKEVKFYEKRDGDLKLVDKKLHTFDYCPLYGLPNNEELKGDAEKVLSLIDAYDRTLSDASNEIEQYRLAYLVFKGLGADEETLAKMKRAGILEMLDEKDDAYYLTKDINDQMIENHLNRLEENIMRFAKSVNFTDEQFAGNVTGVAMKYKLMALENKCITMERKMTSALRWQFKVLCSAWAKKSKAKPDDYLNIWFGFKRNLPANLLEEADLAAKLKGLVSEETRLALLSFVDDVKYELERMQAEQDTYNVSLDDVPTE